MESEYMPYDGWLFIDKRDLTPEFSSLFPGARAKGTMEHLDDWSWVRFISICYTHVGPTILNRCPNLEWVMVRGTSAEKIDMLACRRRGVGVAEAIPTHTNCARYLSINRGSPPYLFYGWGHIGKAAAGLVPGVWPFINTGTDMTVATRLVSEARTVLMSVSYQKGLRRPVVFGSRFFESLVDATLVSVCRPGTTDNAALLKAIHTGRVRRAVLDTPGDVLRDELMATGKVVDTGHTAWLTGMSRQDFLSSVKLCADSIIGGCPCGVVLPRKI
jgi:hypothetical protein